MEILENTKLFIMTKKELRFLSCLLINTPTYMDESIPTACTNGEWIKFNPTFFEKQNKEQRVGLVLHELCHIMYLHAMRVGTREPKKWNRAADYAINIWLIDQGYKLPEGGLIDPQYRDMTAEEIYSLLPDDDSDDGHNDLVPNEEGNEQDVIDKIVRSSQQAELMGGTGNMPTGIERMIHDLLNPKLPWEAMLQRYCFEFVKDDYSWKKRSRRYEEFYTPALHSEHIGTVSIYVDASGSVSEEEFQQYLSEIYTVKRTLNPKILEIVSFDTKIYDVQVLTEYEPFNVSLTGGGGTDLREVAERINGTNSDVVILFTDGHYSPVEYDSEVLHIIVGNPHYKNEGHPVIHLEL